MISYWAYSLLKVYVKITGYYYHSVNVITFSQAQSDYVKQLLLNQTDLLASVTNQVKNILFYK